MKFWLFKFNLTLKVEVSSPQTIGILAKVFCTSGPNLVILVMSYGVDKLKIG